MGGRLADSGRQKKWGLETLSLGTGRSGNIVARLVMSFVDKGHDKARNNVF